MANVGIICPPQSGHLNPMLSLGKELQKRGHRVIVFQIEDIQRKVLEAGLEFIPLGKNEYPKGSVARYLTKVGKSQGLSAIGYMLETSRKNNQMIFQYLPNALKAAKVDLLLVDQVETAPGTVAEFLKLPFISVGNALPSNQEAGIPPYFTSWPYRSIWWAYLRNFVGYWLINQITRSIAQDINLQRQRWNLRPHRSYNDCFSQLAQICQTTADYDYPRKNLPDCFHYIGLLGGTSAEPLTSFPYERLSARPLIYATMGTMSNQLTHVFESIAAASERLDAQLVITLGRGSSIEDYRHLPGNPIVVEYAPQQELLSKAKLMIAHGGTNTVLDSLDAAVPVVAIPVATDQLGNAARLSRAGAGEMLSLNRLSVPRLRETIQRVISQPSYRQNAERLKDSLRRAGGVVKAADIVEEVIKTGKPVLREQSINR
jgi:MGT family glycosyltransferase